MKGEPEQVSILDLVERAANHLLEARLELEAANEMCRVVFDDKGAWADPLGFNDAFEQVCEAEERARDWLRELEKLEKEQRDADGTVTPQE